jgi:hypothetical protein
MRLASPSQLGTFNRKTRCWANQPIFHFQEVQTHQNPWRDIHTDPHHSSYFIPRYSGLWHLVMLRWRLRQQGLLKRRHPTVSPARCHNPEDLDLNLHPWETPNFDFLYIPQFLQSVPRNYIFEKTVLTSLKTWHVHQSFPTLHWVNKKS